MKKELILIVAIIMVLTGILSGNVFSQGIPKIMHHSSRLIDPVTGQPYAPGKYYLMFAIVDPVAKQVLWKYSLWMGIKPDNPKAEYEILLGKYDPIDLPFDAGYILRVIDITSGPPGIILENRALSSGGYAYRSEFTNYADTVLDSSDNSYRDVKDITIMEADNADTVDGKHASDFADSHSLDAADGDPVDVVYVDDSGRVGIGTTSPDDYQNWDGVLHLHGQDHAKLLVTENSGVQTGIFSHVGYNGKIGTQSNHDLTLTAGYWNDVMTLTTTGRVGIGTTNPDHKLEVNGSIAAGFAYRLKSLFSDNFGNILKYGDAGFIGNSDNLALSNTLNNGDLLFLTSPGGGPINEVTRMVINGATGNIGIGTNAPQYRLHIRDPQLGVYSQVTDTGDVTNYGGYFVANGRNGIGVYAEVTGEGDSDVDVRTFAAAVYGNATSTNTFAYTYAGFFTAANGTGVYGTGDIGVKGVTSDGTGVYGSSYSKSATGTKGSSYFGTGVKGESVYGKGVVGSGYDYDFYAAGSGTNYGPFTGGHEVMLCNNFQTDPKPGMIVSVTGKTKIRMKEDGTLSISSTLPTVKLSGMENDKAVLGVFVVEAPLSDNHWYKTKEEERFAVVNALGEGRVWVSNINGEIQAGDYITSSLIPGYGQKQYDDLLHSYTVGKAIESVDWNSVTDTIEFGKQIYKIYLIAVVYTSG